MEFWFWGIVLVILYSYLGYFVIILLWSAVKKLLYSKPLQSIQDLPEVTLMVAAYNEEKVIEEKIKNTFELDYPKEKLHYIWVTDGSTDRTESLLRQYVEITVLHEPTRKGKTAAINRGMQHVKTPIVIFSDANSMLSKASVKSMVQTFQNKKVGCVAGQKRIAKSTQVVSTGEGIYWQYENMLKKAESAVHSTVGAAGELFAIRTELYKPVPEDTILDDFVISFNTVLQGHQIKFAQAAQATENASLNIKEEKKRKVRIASGCLQTTLRYPAYINPLKTGWLAFQYFSHKLLRWYVVPVSIYLLFPMVLYLAWERNFEPGLYTLLAGMYTILVLLSIIGYLFRSYKLPKILYLPYYLYFMNACILQGYIKFLKGAQSAIWDKSERI